MERQSTARPADDGSAKCASWACILIGHCLNDAIRPGTEAPSFQRRAKCSKCGGKRVDVRPNWKEQPMMPTKLG